jgi:hypothetical protein
VMPADAIDAREAAAVRAEANGDAINPRKTLPLCDGPHTTVGFVGGICCIHCGYVERSKQIK